MTVLLALCWRLRQQQRTCAREPTYQEAASNLFLQSNGDAVSKLVAGFDMSTLGSGPVLVATVVNVNDMSRSAPLGRTLSEQYALGHGGQGI